ncbi:3-isopropylmalate dehydrogenase [Streptomyces sp. enrichment culture]
MVRSGREAELMGLFEPVHGSASETAGQGIANPLGAIRPAAIMLYSLPLDSGVQHVQDPAEHLPVRQRFTAEIGLGHHGTGDLEAQLGTLRDVEQAQDPFRASCAAA